MKYINWKNYTKYMPIVLLIETILIFVYLITILN